METMTMDFFGATDVGMCRQTNEDTFFLQPIGGGSCLLAIVVDGVGGNEGGQMAARLVCKLIVDYMTSLPDGACMNEQLKLAVVHANNALHNFRQTSATPFMSCVLTAALLDFVSRTIAVAHVGDTRMYQWRNGTLTKVTSDHSIVGDMEELGLLSEMAAMQHPQRNVITRSVGSNFLEWNNEYVQTHSLPLQVGTLLLCSDGLCDMLTSVEIAKVLSQQGVIPDAKVMRLIKAANKAGGKDNITVLIIELMEDYSEG